MLTLTMPNRNRQRGYEHEKEVVDTLRELGLSADRARSSDGRALGLESGVDVAVYLGGGVPFKIQCKRQKRKINKNYKPAKFVQAQIIREDYGGNYAVLRLEDLAGLLLCIEEARKRGLEI